MAKEFDPIGTWIRYGLSDLYFGYRNQEGEFYRYSVFFHIMAAEKHLKAVLIYANREQYDSLSSFEEKKTKVDSLAREYSHNFKNMIMDVNSLLEKEMDENLVTEHYSGYKSESLIQAMYEGYMETRYPSVRSASRHFPVESAEGMYHDPLGSSFFTDFIEMICVKCWKYLASRELDTEKVVTAIEE